MNELYEYMRLAETEIIDFTSRDDWAGESAEVLEEEFPGYSAGNLTDIETLSRL